MESPADRLRQARSKFFDKPIEAARAYGWKVSTYLAHENGQNGIRIAAAKKYGKAFKVPWTWIVGEDADDDEKRAANRVAIMGYVGAGAEISPEFEQVPEEGLGEIELPFPVDEDAIALEVRGDSMLPVYRPGDVVVVRDATRDSAQYVNREVAVRLVTGQRYLKTLRRGDRPHTYNLESFNASLITGARIEWIGVIVAKVPADQTRAIESGKRRKAPSARPSPLPKG